MLKTNQFLCLILVLLSGAAHAQDYKYCEKLADFHLKKFGYGTFKIPASIVTKKRANLAWMYYDVEVMGTYHFFSNHGLPHVAVQPISGPDIAPGQNMYMYVDQRDLLGVESNLTLEINDKCEVVSVAYWSGDAGSVTADPVTCKKDDSFLTLRMTLSSLCNQYRWAFPRATPAAIRVPAPAPTPTGPGSKQVDIY